MDPFFSSIPVAPPPGIPSPAVIPGVAPFVTNSTAATTVAGGPPPSFDHPSYSDMICEAIAALKDSNGSSKRAIAKYIESAHKDLPPTHSALLTHHLKRLKNNGILVMVKKSYKLASAAGSEVPVPDSTPANPPDPSPGLKRSRGRPPKLKPAVPATTDPIPQQQPAPIPQQQPAPIPHQPPAPMIPQWQPAPIPQQQPAPMIPQQQPAPMIPQQQQAPISQQQSAPTSDGVKRPPGRPRKNQNGPISQLGVRKGRGRPPKTGPKKSPGRPRKPKTVRSVAGANSSKRGRGRPPKASNQLPQPAVVPIHVQPVAVPYADNAAATATAAATTTTAPINAASPRSRGRPKRFAVPAAGVAVTGKGRGRPPRGGGVAAKPITPRKSTGKPVGRPKKNKATNGAPSYGDLQRKLEFFQSKVKQAVEVLRSQISSENNISTIDAIQDLEGLVAMDIYKPFVENAQPAQEPTQAPPPPPHNEGQVY